MKVSESWLREWVNPPLKAEQLAHQLTMAGLEVDGVNPAAGEFTDVVVAEVVSTASHPQADKLTICEINAGVNESYTVVCGASNVRSGLKVALARLGAKLPGGMKIKEVKLRGQLSQGMLCSVSELGLEDRSEGILELPKDAPIGCSLREYMALDDFIFDIDLTPNRADCFSILGIAREVAALNKCSLKSLPTFTVKPQIDETCSITLKAAEACPQYHGRIIRGIHLNAETPLWMKERLRRSGIRSLHPVVDVTNYVMLELGQPMHAFDLNALRGDIDVRYADSGETLTLLNGENITLHDSVLIISDKEKPRALAGVMGGEASSVHSGTTDIFLESAFFNPLAIAGVARKYGLCTDSSQRFERGVDPALPMIAIERATDLLLAIVGGKPGPVTSASEKSFLPALPEITFNPQRVKQLSGVEIPPDEMLAILQYLGMAVVRQENSWQVTPPSHRFDLALEVDLIEEIIRLNGYDNIKAEKMMAHAMAGSTSLYERLSAKIVAFLCHRGYSETISYSFVDPELQQAIYPDAQALQLLNPISSDLSHMRAGLWPGLIASMMYNVHRQQTVMRLFEMGVAFDVVNSELQERACIAALVIGEHGALNWNEPTRGFDFYDVKGDLQALFDGLEIKDVQFEAQSHSALHPGKSARIIVDGEPAGWIGVLHPEISDEMDVHSEVILFELTLERLFKAKPVRYHSISKYPKIRRDLALLAPKEITAAQIEEAVRKAVDSQLLKSFDVFDLYMGKTIPEDKKSVAVALTLQDDKRTLVDAEINTIINAILKKLSEDFAITLRD